MSGLKDKIWSKIIPVEKKKIHIVHPNYVDVGLETFVTIWLKVKLSWIICHLCWTLSNLHHLLVMLVTVRRALCCTCNTHNGALVHPSSQVKVKTTERQQKPHQRVSSYSFFLNWVIKSGTLLCMNTRSEELLPACINMLPLISCIFFWLVK